MLQFHTDDETSNLNAPPNSNSNVNIKRQLSNQSKERHFLPRIEFQDDIQHFRRIQISERQAPLTSYNEADQILASDRFDFQANLYMGWWHLKEDPTPMSAVPYLVRAVEQGKFFLELFHGRHLTRKSDPTDFLPWYLTGRATLLAKDYPEAYKTLQQAVYRNSRVPNVWVTIGILYFQIAQYRDSFDVYTRVLRLNASIWEAWYNVAVLVSPTHVKFLAYF